MYCKQICNKVSSSQWGQIIYQLEFKFLNLKHFSTDSVFDNLPKTSENMSYFCKKVLKIQLLKYLGIIVDFLGAGATS